MKEELPQEQRRRYLKGRGRAGGGSCGRGQAWQGALGAAFPAGNHERTPSPRTKDKKREQGRGRKTKSDRGAREGAQRERGVVAALRCSQGSPAPSPRGHPRPQPGVYPHSPPGVCPHLQQNTSASVPSKHLRSVVECVVEKTPGNIFLSCFIRFETLCHVDCYTVMHPNESLITKRERT